jgi:hypothetical protein
MVARATDVGKIINRSLERIESEGVEAAENRTGLRVVVSHCLNKLLDEIEKYTLLKTID